MSEREAEPAPTLNFKDVDQPGMYLVRWRKGGDLAVAITDNGRFWRIEGAATYTRNGMSEMCELMQPIIPPNVSKRVAAVLEAAKEMPKNVHASFEILNNPFAEDGAYLVPLQKNAEIQAELSAVLSLLKEKV